MRPLAILAFLLLAFPVASSEPVAQNTQMVQPQKSLKPVPAKATLKPPSDLRITLERSPCYGTCPVYRASVNAEGQLFWDGRRYVDHKGFSLHRLDPKIAAEYWGRLEGLGIWKMKDRYAKKEDGCTSLFTDASSTVVELHRRGGKKRVLVYGGCRGSKEATALLDFARDLEAALGLKAQIGL
jgi:hypothetical protein